MPKAERKHSPIVAALMIFAGLVLVLFGTGIDLTVVGLPAGITAQVIGIGLILGGAGVEFVK